MTMPNRRNLMQRLLERREYSTVIADGVTSQCWLYSGGANGDGYGCIRIGEHVRLVHRVSAYLWLDLQIDSVELVRHRCIDRKSCFNPRHLRIGTHSDNNADTIAAGRYSNCTLSMEDVRKLIYAVRSGRMTIAKWCAGHGVSYATGYRNYCGISNTEQAIKCHAACDKRFGGTLFGKPSPIGKPVPPARQVLLLPPEDDSDYVSLLREAEEAAPF